MEEGWSAAGKVRARINRDDIGRRLSACEHVLPPCGTTEAVARRVILIARAVIPPPVERVECATDVARREELHVEARRDRNKEAQRDGSHDQDVVGLWGSRKNRMRKDASLPSNPGVS